MDNKISRETSEDGNTLNARTISLLVKPDQVERLTLAAELGRIRLSLRRSDEDGSHKSDGVGVESLGESEHIGRSKKRQQEQPNPDALLGVIQQSQPVNQGAKFQMQVIDPNGPKNYTCLLYTSPSPRDATLSRMPSSA